MEKQTRYTRYLIFLLFLLGFAGNNFYAYWKVHHWEKPFVVRVYINNGDGRKSTDEYLASLTGDDFKEIATFTNSEAMRYRFRSDAILIQLSKKRVISLTQPPSEPTAFSNMYWSLHFRAWSNLYQYQDNDKSPDVALFLSYFDPEITHQLSHSVGLNGGRVALVNLFASKEYQGSNNVVITHEMLHTFGASDKYDQSNNPLFPIGYADPLKMPTFPQERAEIMGGRIPISSHTSVIPKNLAEVVIGETTAAEIQWLGR